MPSHRDHLTSFVQLFPWGRLKSLIYGTRVEAEEDLKARILEACETLQNDARNLWQSARKHGASLQLSVMKSVAAISNSSCELIKNNTITNSTNNVKRINIYQN